jgi:hypothetical protein
MVAQACNPKYLEGLAQEDQVSKAKTLWRWQSDSSDIAPAWQVWGPEFKLTKKKKKAALRKFMRTISTNGWAWWCMIVILAIRGSTNEKIMVHANLA